MRAKQIATAFASTAEVMVTIARLGQAARDLERHAGALEGRSSPHGTPGLLSGWAKQLRKDAESLLETQKDYCASFDEVNNPLNEVVWFANGATLSLTSDRHLPGFGAIGWAVIQRSGFLSHHPDFAPDRGNEEHLLEFLERVEALTPEEVKHLFG